jgi:predicted outer membrane repeat protein
MWIPSWFRPLVSSSRKLWKADNGRRKPPTALAVEQLETRWVPSTLTVTNNLDSGAGSLRAEIAAARNGDTVVFAPALNGQTITLTSGELLIKNTMTITGPGAGNLSVSGNHASRVFELGRQAHSVALSGLTISNGVSGLGGGIFLQGGSALTVTNCTLSGNTASIGGGIFSGGTLVVTGCTLSGNTATSTTYGGGGIYSAGSPATVSGCTLSGNSAFRGGGIYSDLGPLTVSGCTLSGNSATAAGGGIYVGGTATIQNSTSITGNTAPAGSGADVYNHGVLHLDSTSTIGILDGNAAVRI